MLKALGLDESRGSSRVCYSNNYGGDSEYQLLEVDEDLLKEILESRVSIKGGANDEAVLCSSCATYSVKFVSTSNTVLLIPPKGACEAAGVGDDNTDANERGDGGVAGNYGSGMAEEGVGEARVIAKVGGFIELAPIAPRVEKVDELLCRNPYKDDLDMETQGMVDGVSEEDLGLYTWEYLSSNVQSSEQELSAALKELGAVQIGRYWRTVEPSYMKCLLEVLVLNAVSQGWPLDALRASVVVPSMMADGFSEKLVRHCLATYGVEVERSDGVAWALDQAKICILYAKELLSRQPRWKSEEFMEAWQQLVPSGMRPDLEMLGGEVLLERLGLVTWLKGFSRSALPKKPAERFAALFKEKPKWPWEDLQHYISDLRVPGLSVEAMLLKYTRKTQPDASSPAIYNAR